LIDLILIFLKNTIAPQIIDFGSIPQMA
jgi:hypothetical protein